MRTLLGVCSTLFCGIKSTTRLNAAVLLYLLTAYLKQKKKKSLNPKIEKLNIFPKEEHLYSRSSPRLRSRNLRSYGYLNNVCPWVPLCICSSPPPLNHEDTVCSVSQDVRHLWEIKDTVLWLTEERPLQRSIISLSSSLLYLLHNTGVILSFGLIKLLRPTPALLEFYIYLIISCCVHP